MISFQYILLSFSVFIGIICGIMVSLIAKEELNELIKPLIWARSFISVALLLILLAYQHLLSIINIIMIFFIIIFIYYNHNYLIKIFEFFICIAAGLIFFVAYHIQFSFIVCVLLFLFFMASGSLFYHKYIGRLPKQIDTVKKISKYIVIILIYFTFVVTSIVAAVF